MVQRRDTPSELRHRVRQTGLLLGPIVGLMLFLLLPTQFQDAAGDSVTLTREARAVAAVGLWMAIWWMTEAIPVYATALLPMALFPLTGATSIREAARPYGHEIIYLFLGGFVLALAIERWGLHRRLALKALRAVGTRPRFIVAAFMGIAAFTSMWVTNTATTLMLLPVAISVVAILEEEGNNHDQFSIALLLGIAYAASVGGLGTIVGTAPNIFVVSFVSDQLGREISFVRWMMLGVPIVLVLLPVIWWVLTRLVFPLPEGDLPRAHASISRQAADLGAMEVAERRVFWVFLLTAAAWITRPLLNRWEIGGQAPLGGLTDPGIAIICALLLFLMPAGAGRGVRLMDWATAVRLPWGLLILFGGGLSLASALDSSGFSAFLGSQASGLEGFPQWLLVGLVITIMIFLTELTSNTATTATLVPVMYALGLGLGIEPLILVVPAAIAASCAFMLPVATPPNAIVFGSGRVSIPQMSRAGLYLNLLAIILLTMMAYLVIVPVLGI